MKNPFIPLMERVCRRHGLMAGRRKNQKIYRALSRLYPMGNPEELYRSFQVKRLAAMFVILILGTVSALLLCLCSRTQGKLAEGAQLIRKEWGAGDYRVVLQARAGEWSREIPFLVEERRLSEKEREELLIQLRGELPERIRGDNEDLRHVSEDLELMTSLEGYPFRLAWSSSDNERIDRNGRVNRTGISPQGESIRLTARIYGQEEEVFSYDIFLVPETLSAEESFYRELAKELGRIGTEQESRRQVTLPGSLQGQSIQWEETAPGRAQKGILLLLLTVLCCALVCGGMENDLERSCKKRDRQLLLDYPEFVSKLRLYLSAGLTVRSAFFRMTSDYLEQQGKGGEHYLYQEMKLACHQLENGVAQEQVYQELGKRCGEMRYRRLSFLLSVHLKQGNQQLLALLSQEADSAQEDRRSMARKAGEEAGTKLLLPMMLMLVVVMFLVLLPAWMDFGHV